MAMYEYGIEHGDQLERIVGPLKGFRDRLRDEADTLKLIAAYERYIQEELRISEPEADTVITGQQRMGILPMTETLLEDRLLSVEGYRMGICKTVMPYKSMACSVVDYQLWLPNAFEVIIPSSGESRHAPDVCLITHGITDESCEIGECPVRYLLQQAQAAQYPDFSTPDYMVRPERMCQSVLEFLSCARDKGIINQLERRKYRSAYLEQYQQIFPAM